MSRSYGKSRLALNALSALSANDLDAVNGGITLRGPGMKSPFAIARSAFLVALSSASVALIACSGSGGGAGGAGGSPVAMSAYGKRYVDTVCPALRHCCTDNGFDEEARSCPDAAAAIQSAFDRAKSNYPTWVWNDVRAGNCIAKIASAYGRCAGEDHRQVLTYDPDCQEMFVGGKDIGESCSLDEPCSRAQGGRCVPKRDADTGTESEEMCVRMKAAAVGDPCWDVMGAHLDASLTYGDCGPAPDLFCGPEAKCRKRIGEGETCVIEDGRRFRFFLRCEKGLYCGSTTERCEAAPKLGEPCPQNACAVGAVCDSATQKCVAIRAAGESCTGASAPGSVCEHGCDTKTGKCQKNDVVRTACKGTLL